MKLRGQVFRKTVAKGSKSERLAVVLRTTQGDYVLRREGGNAFRDAELDGLVGRKIECEGEVAVNTLIMSGWSVIE